MTDYQIKSTTDYAKFKRTKGNRTIIKNHLDLMVNEIAAHPDTIKYNPILVNRDFEVIDGQHRLEALKDLSQPVYYIQVDDLSLADAQRINNINYKWTPLSYAQSFVELGNTAYQDYIDFVTEFKVKHGTALRYLANGQTGNIELSRLFKTGYIKLADLDKAFAMGRALIEVSTFFKSATNQGFSQAFLNVYLSGHYNHQFFMDIIDGSDKTATAVIRPQETITDYMREIERIYNLKLPLSDQVRFF